MGAYSVVLGDSITLAGPLLKIDPNRHANINDKGEVESTNWMIRIRAAEVTGGPSGIATQIWVTKADLVEAAAQKVEIKLDGATVRTFEPSSAFKGPFITEYDAPTDDGAGESHHRYSLTIFVQTKDTANCYDLESSHETFKNRKGELVREIWRASAKAKTADDALDCILDKKPSQETEERIATFDEQARAEAEWTWEQEAQSSKIHSWS